MEVRNPLLPPTYSLWHFVKGARDPKRRSENTPVRDTCDSGHILLEFLLWFPTAMQSGTAGERRFTVLVLFLMIHCVP